MLAEDRGRPRGASYCFQASHSPPIEGKDETGEATRASGAIDATQKNETRHDEAASEPVVQAWVEGVSGPESRGSDDGVAPHAEDGETKGREASADHRHAAEHTPGWLKHVKHWLNEATKSIPAYLERTAMVIILVPLTEHVDRPGELCDYANWRGRGWCRLELVGAVLARTNVRLMLVQSAQKNPEFMVPIDALHLACGHGTYTCCARNHDFGGGPGSAPCDIMSVARVMSRMVDAKIEHLWNQARTFEARVYIGLKHWFMRGMPSGTPDTDKTGLALARAMFRWRGERKEAEEKKRCGVGILFWSALSNNLDAVREYLSAAGRDEPSKSGRLCSLRHDHSQMFSIFHIRLNALHIGELMCVYERDCNCDIAHFVCSLREFLTNADCSSCRVSNKL